MNKLVVTVVVLLALLLLAMPRVLGSITEARVRERVSTIDAGGVLSAEVKSFDRGWFGSTARIDLGLAPKYLAQVANLSVAGDPGALSGRAMIAVDFAHGPVAVLDGVHFGWSTMVAHLDPEMPGIAALQQQLGVPYVFEFRGRTGFSGGLAFDADMPPVVLPVDGARFKFSGAVLEGTYAGAAFESNARIDSVEFSSPTGTFALSNLRAATDNQLLSQYVMPGEATLSIERVSIVDTTRSATPVFEANKVSVASHSGIDDAGVLMNMQVSYGIDSMRIEDIEVTAAKLGVGVRNVDVAALQAYTAAAGDLASSGAVTDPNAMLAALAPQIERALAASPSLTIDPITVRVDGEPFDGRLEVATNTARLPPAGTLDFDDPLLVLGLMNTDAEIRVSKPLAQRLVVLASKMQLAYNDSIPPDQLQYMAEAQAGLLLVTLVGQGVLVEDGDGYRSAARFADGALTLNGNALPFGLP